MNLLFCFQKSIAVATKIGFENASKKKSLMCSSWHEWNVEKQEGSANSENAFENL